ncbi:MAG TPA: 50S ribosomal protein L11 methyltransferase, partial [Gammaproteobacteria bacterium]|nr:50S ribosomal protein L11 methyltransferase [Gammaproteobacteria bacterium]
DSNVDVAGIMVQLTKTLKLAGTPDYRVETVADQDWTRAWLKDFKPLQFGERLWIVPSAWEPPEPEAVNILLDPGLAFGTGTHPTTALCLEWLEKQALTNKTVLDFGCGSGVLAIAALKLGAVAALGVDNDPQALTASESNAGRNQVMERLQLCLPEALPQSRFPIVVANILANPLIELAGQLANLTEPGGHIALSGILSEQGEIVEAAYAPFFELAPIQEKDGWLLISGQRKR